MNNAQRLFVTLAIMVGAAMIAFPPFLIRGPEVGQKSIMYSLIWEPPYPASYNPIAPRPYCDGPFYFFLLIQLALFTGGCSYLYGRLGGSGTERSAQYPEYYRP